MARKKKTFTLIASTRNAKEFTVFADQAARLRPHGHVEINVSSLSGKDWSEVPDGGSAWHEYASYGVGLHKFFPHPKLKPFVDAKFVAANRRLLASAMKIVRQKKLGACFAMHEPHFLPEAFFAAYPHLRGGRIDHPRRSKQEEFAMCLDHPEGREIFRAMAAELGKAVPELSLVRTLTNDAGAGFCWTEYLYPGPNGPAPCRMVPVGQRIANYVADIRAGVGKRDLDVQIGGNFTRLENESVPACIDDRTFWGRGPQRTVGAGSVGDNPVRGIIDPVGLLAALDRARDPKIERIFVGFGTNYRRHHELPEMAELVVDVIDAYCRKPAKGLLNRLKFLRALCAKWAGDAYADRLMEAFVTLHEAYALKHAAFGRFTGNYVGVSMRLINRPLVAMPDKLTEEEEAYFLPHVFSIYWNEARMDYMDWHGGRLSAGGVDELGPWPRVPGVDQFRGMLAGVADVLEGIKGRSKAAGVLRRMALSLRIYACIMRSIGNFYSVQTVRDRNADKLLGEPTIPPKVGSMTGDPDLLLLHEFMRDELDNTTELIDILENGGLAQMSLAPTPELEDTFLLGPDIVDQLKQKMAIMRAHWLDASHYMATPHK